MPKEKILVIDDEEKILKLFYRILSAEGYQVIMKSSGEAGLEAVESEEPDLILLDLILPDIYGLDICKTLKKQPHTATIPIIIVSQKCDETDIVVGLELGAEDYVPKPFSNRVLLARIKNVLKKAKVEDFGEENILRIGGLEIDIKKYEARFKGKRANLTATEFNILALLAKRPGVVFSRNQIIEAVRADSLDIVERAVAVQIVGLRKKLGAAGRYIETVRGMGYKLKIPE